MHPLEQSMAPRLELFFSFSLENLKKKQIKTHVEMYFTYMVMIISDEAVFSSMETEM